MRCPFYEYSVRFEWTADGLWWPVPVYACRLGGCCPYAGLPPLGHLLVCVMRRMVRRLLGRR